MTAAALAFMIGSWALVLGLTAWCFHRVLRAGRRSTGDGERRSGKAHGVPDAGATR